MHAKYNKKAWHRRERGIVQGRAENSRPGRILTERQFGDDGQLTAPVTLTVTVVRPPIPTNTPDIPSPITTTTFVIPSPSPQTLSVPAETVLTSDFPSSATTTTLAPTSTPSPSPPTVSGSPTTPPSSIVILPITSSVPEMPDKGANQAAKNNPKLSTGAIAGIVIGCLVVLIIAIIFGLRKRSARKQSMSRGSWSRKLGFRPRDLEPTPYTYNQDSSINGQGLSSGMGMDFTGQPVVTTSNTGNTRPTSPRSMSTVGLGLPRTLPSAYGPDINSAGSNSLSQSQKQVLFTTVVSRSFVPTLPDELSISTGETLKVLQEFDDGWAECMTLDGEIGMVPLECFDRRDERRKSSRFSSLPGARRIV